MPVQNPTTAQRRDLPPAAFAAPFYADGEGRYSTGGTFQRSKSKLPHHVNTVTSPTSDETVDVPRLRNALARFDQTAWSDFGDAAERVKSRARSHLDAHKKSVLGG